MVLYADVMEYQGIVRKFDVNDSGSLEIAEVSQQMFDYVHGDSGPDPPPPEHDWGTQRFDRAPPPPPGVRDMVAATVAASRNPLLKSASGAHLDGGGGGGDDGASVPGSDYSFSEEVRGRFWPGPAAERHYRFLAKLRETLAQRYKHLYRAASGTARLFVPKMELLEAKIRKVPPPPARVFSLCSLP